MNYGLPYKGSKTRIAKKIVDALPAGKILVDLFCGGGAITHCAMLSGKWNRFVINDLDEGMVKLFADCVNGKIPNGNEWISRDKFFARKDSEPWIKCCYSFGNNCRDYLYSKRIEPYKHACHLAIVNDDWDLMQELCPEVSDSAQNALNGIIERKERRLNFGPAIVRKLKEISNPELMNNPLYASCHRKKGALERLERLQSLETYSMDYQEVPIPEGATVYADPPYKGTNRYNTDFDSDSFIEWARTRPFPVYISEYQAPADFVPILGTNKRSSFSASNNSLITIEKVFVHEKFAGRNQPKLQGEIR